MDPSWDIFHHDKCGYQEQNGCKEKKTRRTYSSKSILTVGDPFPSSWVPIPVTYSITAMAFKVNPNFNP